MSERTRVELEGKISNDPSASDGEEGGKQEARMLAREGERKNRE